MFVCSYESIYIYRALRGPTGVKIGHAQKAFQPQVILFYFISSKCYRVIDVVIYSVVLNGLNFYRQTSGVGLGDKRGGPRNTARGETGETKMR